MKRTFSLIAALVLFATLAIMLRIREKPRPSNAAPSATALDAGAVATPQGLQPSAVHIDAGAQSPQPHTMQVSAQTQTTSAARALAEIRALVDQGHISAARVRAEHALQEIPAGPEARQIMSLTGVHPHP